MFELLSEQDKENIVSWISHFGPANDGRNPYNVPEHNMAPLNHILRVWDNAKEDYLHSLFGDNLILERPYTYRIPLEDMRNTIARRLRHNSAWDRMVNFVSGVTSKVAQLNELRYGIWELVDMYTLADGNCERVFKGLYNSDPSFTINLPNGKKYKVQRTMKPLKVIYKLMETWGARCDYDEYQWRQDYEEIRILLSQCTNNADLKGTLCLSIHPLDYMTMSDNDNNWGSCMRWRHNGEYSQGTIEMMNSYTVIVAYLHNPDKTMELPNGNTWNSKIWRELFVVDSNKVITEVKPYPYDDANLTKTCLHWIYSLMGNPDGWAQFEMEGDGTDIVIDKNANDGEGLAVAFNFNTGYMYSDFGSNYRPHMVMINLPKVMEKHVEGHHGIYLDVNYSGDSECVWCGDYTLDSDDWSDGDETCGMRICVDCSDSIRCACCGAVITGNDYYTDSNGDPICYSCFDEYYTTDAITGEICHRDNTITLYLAKGHNEENPDFTGDCIDIIDDVSYFKYVAHNYFKVEKAHSYDQHWYTRYYVFVDECTSDGLGLFNYWDPEQE